MRGRFGSPIFGPRALSALFRRLPPRIELSVQISILTANLPANSPLLRRRPAAAAASSFLHQRPPFSIPDLPRSASFSLCPIAARSCTVSREEATLLSLLYAPNFLTRRVLNLTACFFFFFSSFFSLSFLFFFFSLSAVSFLLASSFSRGVSN